MKIKDGFVLREVAGTKMVVPIGGECVNFNGMITLNDTACFLWEALLQDVTENFLITALLGEYDVSEDLAKKDVEEFIAKLKEADILE